MISNLIEKDWELDNILRKGEMLLIQGPSNIGYELSTTILSSQTALALSLGQNIMLFKNMSNKKVLFINTYLDNRELFSITSTQIGGETNFSKYSNNFMMISIPSSKIEENKEKIKEIVKNSCADVIVWDNINRLVNKETTLIKAILLIKEISGLKTKIVSHYFNQSKHPYEIFTLSQESSAFITLSHIVSTEKYTLNIEKKNGNFLSSAKCYRHEKRLSFYNDYVNLYQLPNVKEPISHDEGIIPPLP